MTSTPRRKTRSADPRDCLAFIVGPNRFQNTLLAGHIETNSQWRCRVVDTVAAIAAEEGGGFSTAVLHDCFGVNGRAMLTSLLAELEQLSPEWALALFNVERREGLERIALPRGIQGFFYRDDSSDTLLKGLGALFGGAFWVSRQKMTEIVLESGEESEGEISPAAPYPHELTRREVEVLRLLTVGASNSLISEKLSVSPNTVRTHLGNIFKKINVSSRLKASVWAAEALFSRSRDGGSSSSL